jgi:hypothetical protein
MLGVFPRQVNLNSRFDPERVRFNEIVSALASRHPLSGPNEVPQILNQKELFLTQPNGL